MTELASCTDLYHVADADLDVDLESGFGIDRQYGDNYKPKGQYMAVPENEYTGRKNGVRVTFHTTGLLYAFDVFLLLDCIVQGLVLISTANMAVAFTARFLLGTKSVLYNNVMVDKLDALTQYSQFTSQAVVASVVFDILDDNGQGELEKVELFRRMTELFYDNKETFSWEMVATLVELVFDCASTDNNDHWEMLQEDGKTKSYLSRTSTNDVLT
eukprot:gene24824-30244_t